MVSKERQEQYRVRRNFLANRRAARKALQYRKLKTFVVSVSVITQHRCPSCDAIDIVGKALKELEIHD